MLLTLGLLAVLAPSCSSSAARQSHSGSTVGLTVFSPRDRVRLPALAGTTLSGRSLTASSYAAGSPLVVDVWASWCYPCRQELPLLARAARQGVRVLGIDERDSASRALAFADDHGVTYPSLHDPDGRLLGGLRMLPQNGIPSALIVAADGIVVARVVGPLSPDMLHQALRKAAS